MGLWALPFAHHFDWCHSSCILKFRSSHLCKVRWQLEKAGLALWGTPCTHVSVTGYEDFPVSAGRRPRACGVRGGHSTLQPPGLAPGSAQNALDPPACSCCCAVARASRLLHFLATRGEGSAQWQDDRYFVRKQRGPSMSARQRSATSRFHGTLGS